MFYKIVTNGMIAVIGTGSGGAQITEAEYNQIKAIIDNRPAAPEGYGYQLTESLEWELYELPHEDDDPELTDSEALEILLGGAV